MACRPSSVTSALGDAVDTVVTGPGPTQKTTISAANTETSVPEISATATFDPSLDRQCRQTIQDFYNKVFCPDDEAILENLFTEPFELNVLPLLHACENGPFTEAVEIDRRGNTGKHYSYAVTVKFWYPAGQGSGPEPYLSLILINTAIGEDGVCRIAGVTGGG